MGLENHADDLQAERQETERLQALEALEAHQRVTESDLEAEKRRAIERDEALAQQKAAAAVLEDMATTFDAEVPGLELAPGRKTEWAMRLLCAWSFGKPENADEVMQGLAVLTVESLCKLTGGR